MQTSTFPVRDVLDPLPILRDHGAVLVIIDAFVLKSLPLYWSPPVNNIGSYVYGELDYQNIAGERFPKQTAPKIKLRPEQKLNAKVQLLVSTFGVRMGSCACSTLNSVLSFPFYKWLLGIRVAVNRLFFLCLFTAFGHQSVY